MQHEDREEQMFVSEVVSKPKRQYKTVIGFFSTPHFHYCSLWEGWRSLSICLDTDTGVRSTTKVLSATWNSGRSTYFH
jgi:hypothetical protein